MANKFKAQMEKTLVQGFRQFLIEKNDKATAEDFLADLLASGRSIAKGLLKEKDASYNLHNIRILNKGITFQSGFMKAIEGRGLNKLKIPPDLVHTIPLIMAIMMEEELEKERDEIINKQVK